MKMNILALIITLVVGVILTGALLGPVVADITTTEATFVNEGAFYVELDPTESYTVEYNYTEKPGVVVINGMDMDIPFSTGYTIMAIDNAILRLQSGDLSIQYKGDNYNIVGIDELNLTVANGSVSGTYKTGLAGGTKTQAWPTTTYNKCYIASPVDSELIMTQYNVPVMIDGDAEIFAFGQTRFNDDTLRLIKIEGTINNGVTVQILDRTTGEATEGATVTNLSINATEIDGYQNLYQLTSITFVGADDDSSANVTYSAYIVPTEVTAERSQHLDAGQNALIGVIPIMVIVALLMIAVGAIAYRRAD